jgi:PIN domain nuclease of toxin-antitoxin system
MNYLLDTHTLIWFIIDDPILPLLVKRQIEDTDNKCFCSVASIWEIGIKHSIGKLDLKFNLVEIIKITESSLIELLPIDTSHIVENSNLPLHHRDPFDRLLIAQAQVENLTIITKDTLFSTYGVKTFWI